MMAKSRSYDYTAPSYEETVGRAERKGSMFDNMLKDVTLYKTKQGANLLRILPPGWPKAIHYGLTVHVHNSVGPNDRRFLCLRDNPTSPHKRCPICEALYDLGPRATSEDKAQLKAKQQVIYYVVDRDNEKDGLQVWLASPTVDSEIAAQSINRRNQSVLDIVDPDNGYDIEFTRSGITRNNTRYRGFQIMREPSPLAESSKRTDALLDQAFDRPLPSVLQFYTPEHIEEVFYGRAQQEDDDDDRPKRDRNRPVDDGDDRPPLRRTRQIDNDDADDGADDPPPPRRQTRRPVVDDDELPDRAGRRERVGRNNDDDAQSSPPRHERSRPTQRHDDADDPDDPPPPRRRQTRMAGELDDEIPSDAGRRGRTNGREEPNPPRAAKRTRLDDGEDGGGAEQDRSARRADMRNRINRE